MESQNRKDQILSTAYEIAGKQGLENLHARTIGAALEINHAAVHYYFPKRTDLLLALAKYAHQRYRGDLERVVSNRATATQRLEAHIALYEAYAKPASRFFRVMASLFVAAVDHDDLKAVLKAILDDQQKQLQMDLDAARGEGGIDASSVFANGEALGGYLFGLCYRSQMSGSFEGADMIDALFNSLFRR